MERDPNPNANPSPNPNPNPSPNPTPDQATLDKLLDAAEARGARPICPHLPVSPCISLHLTISPYISRGARREADLPADQAADRGGGLP